MTRVFIKNLTKRPKVYHHVVNIFILVSYSCFLTLLQGFIECLCTHLKKLSEIVKVCFEEIAEWRHLQQRSLCGYPCPPSLDKLQEVYVHLDKNFSILNFFCVRLFCVFIISLVSYFVYSCETLAELLWKLFQQASQVSSEDYFKFFKGTFTNLT